ncbi:MAG TPA: nitroreductase family protein [bacterium]|nr:nitroreductase family protein [bacterium]
MIRKLFLVLIAAPLIFEAGACFPEEQSAPATDAISVIHSRKSVRHYTEKPVTPEDIDVLLRAGMAAPTAADTRPWEFVVVDERETLDDLSAAVEWGKMLKRAKAAIVVCGDTTRALSGVEQEYWIQDCSAASENILLAAEAKGLGAVWVGVFPVKERVAKVQRILELPEHVVPLNVISIGWPAGIEKPKDKYDAKYIHRNKWQ